MAVKLLVMDVDGTLTDGLLHIGPDGELFKSFNVKDGYGITSLSKLGISTAILTGRQSRIVEYRANELKIEHIYQQLNNKLVCLHALVEELNLTLAEVAYIGDDENDLECIDAINSAGGFTGCPSDAIQIVKMTASYVCKSKGGNGAVREFIDAIINL